MLWLTMVTGCRRGEVSALRWKHVDFDRRLLIIQRSNAHPRAGIKEMETKTPQQRRVALDPQTIELLMAHRLRWEQRCADLGCALSPPRRDNRQLFLWHAFQDAFGMSEKVGESFRVELGWLFDLRGQAAHPYTEAESPERHPAGITTGAECSRFNAVTSGRAVDVAMTVLDYAADPPAPHSRWIERWTAERRPYHKTVIASLRNARATQPLRQATDEEQDG